MNFRLPRGLRTHRIELLAIGMMAIGVYLLAVLLDASEWLSQYMGYKRLWQATDLLFVALFLAAAFSVYAWRRWNEAVRLLRERDAALKHLDAAARRAEIVKLENQEFLANVSHKIHTPMNSIIGMIELVLGSQLTNQQRDQLSVAASSARSLLEFLDQVLDVAKVEKGKLELEAKSGDALLNTQQDHPVGLIHQDRVTKYDKLALKPLAAANGAKVDGSYELPATCESGQRQLRILLVEDNIVNQRVAAGMLEKRGHRVVVTSNGKEAIHALACQEFDLVFMDVQMPVMDGLAATETIRDQERGTGRHVPIAAMTAHAMKGDRDRCIRAGMDDYIPKPVDPGVLNAVIERLCPVEKPEEEAKEKLVDAEAVKIMERVAAEEIDPETFDLKGLMQRVEDDLELADEMIEMFLTSSPTLLDELEAAVGKRDSDAIERTTHALKGALQNMCAARATEAAAILENACEEEDLEQTLKSFARFREELKRFQSALEVVSKAENAEA